MWTLRKVFVKFSIKRFFLFIILETFLKNFIARRSLEEISEIETVNEEGNSKMSLTYRIFFTISNLGGLYTLLILGIGTLLRPVIDKIFIHEAINYNHIENKRVISNNQLF